MRLDEIKSSEQHVQYYTHYMSAPKHVEREEWDKPGYFELYKETDRDQFTQVKIGAVETDVTSVQRACIADANKNKYSRFDLSIEGDGFSCKLINGVWHWLNANGELGQGDD